MRRFPSAANGLGLVAFLALGACAGQPRDSRPEMALPGAFRNAPSAAAAVKVDPRWWRGFGDPVLDRLIDRALADSLTLEIAAARLDQAAAGLRAAQAARRPLLNGQASVTEQRASIADQVGQGVSRVPGFQRAADVYNLGLAASWEIDLFGRLAAANRAARADLASAEANVAGARLTVAGEVASAYLDARELQARLAVAKARLGTLAELDRLVALRVSRGVAARLEGDQSAADLASARAAIPALEAGLEAQYNRLDVLLGRVPGAARAELGEGAIPAPPVIDAEGGPAALLFRRPDLAAAERAVAAADARVAQALAERWPRLNLAAAIGILSAGTS
ncbi:MAG: TolC family protein, partial [Sphingomonas sp.]|nr:TolC family protein [Sphingomonas sp.]